MELLERGIPLPLAAAHRGITILALHGRLWRATRPDGTVLGYVEIIGPTESEGKSEGNGEKFRSKRLRARAQGYLVIGEFWNADEAIDALR
jgi:hypothetical protein